jgi:hypothetical protein
MMASQNSAQKTELIALTQALQITAGRQNPASSRQQETKNDKMSALL